MTNTKQEIPQAANEYPPLPEDCVKDSFGRLYSVDQMHAYADATWAMRENAGPAVLRAEVETLKRGYEAARLEIDTLRKRLSNIDEVEAVAKKLALDLECMILNPTKWYEAATKTLQDYNIMMDRMYPQEQVSPLGKD